MSNVLPNKIGIVEYTMDMSLRIFKLCKKNKLFVPFAEC